MLAFKPHGDCVFQVTFSPDGATIATCGSRPDVCVSDAISGRVLWRRTDPKSVRILGLAYSPDGTRLAAVGWAEVFILDAATGAEVSRHLARGYSVAYSPDGLSVVTNAKNMEYAIRTDLRTGRVERLEKLAPWPMLNRLQFSPDGQQLAVLGEARVSVMNTQTQSVVARIPLTNFTAGVGVLAFHPTASVLVYSEAAKLIPFDLQSNAPIAERKRSKKYIQDGSFTPNGKHLITVSNEATAVMWETAGWIETASFAWDIGPLKSVSIAPDGNRAVCASDRGRVVIWDLDG